MSDQGLDPLGFVVESLAARGALVEFDRQEAFAVLPGPLARGLGISEEVRLGLNTGIEGLVPCGLGTPLLEVLTKEARATVPVAWVRLQIPVPSASQAMAAAAKVVLRNGLADPVDAIAGEGTHMAAHAVTGGIRPRHLHAIENRR